MAKNEALRVAELRSRLEVVVPRLLSNAAAGSAATAAAPSASASAGPPSARLVDIETATTKPTEAEVLTRSLVPLLQLTADDGGSGDHAHEGFMRGEVTVTLIMRTRASWRASAAQPHAPSCARPLKRPVSAAHSHALTPTPSLSPLSLHRRLLTGGAHAHSQALVTDGRSLSLRLAPASPLARV